MSLVFITRVTITRTDLIMPLKSVESFREQVASAKQDLINAHHQVAIACRLGGIAKKDPGRRISSSVIRVANARKALVRAKKALSAKIRRDALRETMVVNNHLDTSLSL